MKDSIHGTGTLAEGVNDKKRYKVQIIYTAEVEERSKNRAKMKAMRQLKEKMLTPRVVCEEEEGGGNSNELI